MFHPLHYLFRADVTIICVDIICITECFIQIPILIQIYYDPYHWTWHLCTVVRISLAIICFCIIILIWKTDMFHPLHTPFALMLQSFCVDFHMYNWMLYSIPIVIKFAMIIYWTWHLCTVVRNLLAKICFRIIVLIWILHVSSITHPFRADVTIICVDIMICKTVRFIQIPILIKFAMIIYWTWHLCTLVRNSLAKICFRIIVLLWKLHVSSIIHPSRADVTIICVDFICIIWMLYSIPILIKFAMIIYWTWHLCTVVRNSLAKICFV